MSGLTVRGLTVDLPGGPRIVNGVDLDLAAGEVLALVGPSGAGKSLTVRAIARLLPPGARVGGTARLNDVDLLAVDQAGLRRLRGTALGCMFQNPTAGLNPTMTVGGHLLETLRAHHRLPRVELRERGLTALAGAGLERPAELWQAYPFQLSGGQAQRVALALATACHPAVLLADEITTELDAVTQAQVLDTLRAHAAAGRSVLLVTHDLAVAARWADTVAVLEAGRVTEHGPAAAVLHDPQAALTRTLLRAAQLSSAALS